MTILEARSVSFEAAGGTTILDGVDLVAQPGAVTAIVGPNGAGKSTLLRLLAGLAIPSAGEILIDGRPVASFSVAELARLRAYMSSRLPERISFPVREVVRMGRHPWTSTRRESESAVDRSIAELNLETLADRAHSTLSTGEARRTHVARILAQDAGLMMLDEPESGLDIGYAELVLDRLRGAARRPGTVVAALHDLNAAARIADRVVLLDSGRVISDGRPDEVLTGDLLTRVYRHPVEVIPHPGGTGLLVLPQGSDEPVGL